MVTDRTDYYSSRGFDPSRYFNADTRFEICAVWGAIFRSERAMEQIRQTLAADPYFNGHKAFEFCSRQRFGTVNANDLREVLGTVGFYATDREIQGLFWRLDRDKDGVISSNDWLDEF